MFFLWPLSATIEVGNLSVCICGKSSLLGNLFLAGGVLEMHVLKFGRGRDGSPHEDIVKNYEKVSINAK